MLLLCLPLSALRASSIKAVGNSFKNSEASPAKEDRSMIGGRESVRHACNPRIAGLREK